MTTPRGQYGDIEVNTIKLGGTAITSTAAEINLLDGAGAVVASGTQASHIDDIANDASGTQIATAVNAILAALEAFGITAVQ